jgi:uncharacterized membrane protein
MATLSAWKFDSADGAAEATERLEELIKGSLIDVYDAAIVTWPVGKKKPKTHQLNHLAAGGSLSGLFWGLLFGLIFFVPLIGAAIGAALGAMTGALVDTGIDDEFIDSVRQQVTPGTSALFVLSDNAVVDKVSEAFAASHPHLVSTNLSDEEEAKLRAAFGDDED